MMRICPHCETPTLEDVCPDDGYQTVDAALYMDPDQDPFVGTVFHSRYRIETRLEIGGMSTVYRATQLAVGRPVALKIMNRTLARDLKAVARFQQEARAVAGLRHPNTIRLFDYGQSEDGHLFLVTEFLEGQPLGVVIDREGAMPSERIIHIGRQILDALAEAHAAGIVHRDLKPDNIFLTSVGLQRDYVKILDFGIAKVTHRGQGDLTSNGLVLGSPGYMAPEQVQAQPSTEQTDIYAVGTLVYEMLTGEPIFEGDNALELAVKHVHHEPPKPTLDGRPLSGPLVDFAMRCLAKNPAARPHGAAGALQELLACAEAALAVRTQDAAGPEISAVIPEPTPGHREHIPSTIPRAVATGGVVGMPLQGHDPSTDVTQHFSPRVSSRGPRRASRRTWFLVTALAFLGVVAVAVYFLMRPPPNGSDPSKTAKASPPTVKGEPTRQPSVVPVVPFGVDAGTTLPQRPDAASRTAGAPDVPVAAPATPDAGPTPVAGDAGSEAVAADAGQQAAADVKPDAGVPMSFVLIKTVPPTKIKFAIRKDDKWVELGEKTSREPFEIRWPASEKPPRIRMKRYHHENEVRRIKPWQVNKTIFIEMEYDDSW